MKSSENKSSETNVQYEYDWDVSSEEHYEVIKENNKRWVNKWMRENL